jgi:tetratricopeptide (TPR) repeat protein
MIDNYRYPGTRPFYDTDIDGRLFFGREKEIDSLLHHILKENLVVLYGKSGVGKTSLINAGLNQVLRDIGFIPFVVRFDNPGKELLQEVYDCIEGLVKQKNLGYEEGKKGTLLQFFKTAVFREPGGRSLKPVMILDQFEGIFTQYSPGSRERFTPQLAELANSKVHDVKIIFSIRKDYLRQLDEMTDDIPCLLDGYWFELQPLDRRQAERAIIEPAQVMDETICTAPFKLSQDAVAMMLDFLSRPKEGDGIERTEEVEPFLLQLLCRHMEDIIREKPGKREEGKAVDKYDLGGETVMQQVIGRYYDDRVKRLKPVLNRYRACRLFEKGLTGVQVGNRNRCLSLEERELKQKFGISENLLAKLVNIRLLRSKSRDNNIYYEPSHDTLAVPIHESRKKHRLIMTMIGGIIAISVLVTAFFYIYHMESKLERQQLYDEAVERRKNRDYNGAVEKYNAILKIDKTDIFAYMELGQIFFKKKEYDNAAKNFREALKIDKTRPALYVKLARTYIINGEPEKAIDIFRQAIAVNPRYVTIYRRIGNELYRRGKPKLEEKIYEIAAESGSKDAFVYVFLGHSYVEAKKYDLAIKYYGKPLEIKSNSFYAYNNMGSVVTRLKMGTTHFERFKKALKIKENEPRKPIDINKDYAYVYYNLAARLAGLKRYDAAIEAYKKTIKIDPEFLMVKINLAEIYMLTEHFDTADELANQVLREKNIFTDYKVAMKFVSLTSRLFLGKEPQPLKSITRFEEHVNNYKADPDYPRRSWVYGPAKEFIERNKKLPPAQTRRLLRLAESLDRPFPRN